MKGDHAIKSLRFPLIYRVERECKANKCGRKWNSFPPACEARGIEQTEYTRGEVVPSRDRSFLHHDRQINGIYLSDCTQYRCTWTDDLPSGGCYAYLWMDGLDVFLVPLSRMALMRLIKCTERRQVQYIYGICVAFILKTSYWVVRLVGRWTLVASCKHAS